MAAGASRKSFLNAITRGRRLMISLPEIERLRRELGMREANMGGASGRRRALAPRAKNLRTRIYR